MMMAKAPRETCSHEACDMEPCSAFENMTYVNDDVWGWGTSCESCERFFPGTLPEDHAEARHGGLREF